MTTRRKTTPKAKKPKKPHPLAKSHGRTRGSPLAHGALRDPFKSKGLRKV